VGEAKPTPAGGGVTDTRWGLGVLPCSYPRPNYCPAMTRHTCCWAVATSGVYRGLAQCRAACRRVTQNHAGRDSANALGSNPTSPTIPLAQRVGKECSNHGQLAIPAGLL